MAETGDLSAELAKALEALGRQAEPDLATRLAQEEDELWNPAKRSRNPEDIDEYIQAYPRGWYVRNRAL